MTKKFTEANIPANLRLHVHHVREPDFRTQHMHYAGVTVARLYERGSDRLVSEGVAYCNLWKDHPSKKIGRAIAVGRALKEAKHREMQVVRIAA
jgi:hypothetical protein